MLRYLGAFFRRRRGRRIEDSVDDVGAVSLSIAFCATVDGQEVAFRLAVTFCIADVIVSWLLIRVLVKLPICVPACYISPWSVAQVNRSCSDDLIVPWVFFFSLSHVSCHRKCCRKALS